MPGGCETVSITRSGVLLGDVILPAVGGVRQAVLPAVLAEAGLAVEIARLRVQLSRRPTIHDARPANPRARRLPVLMDEAVADAFAPDGDDLARIKYGFSLFICLPDGLSSPLSLGTGTVMRPSTLQGYGEAAGFGAFGVLPIEGFGF